MDSREDEIARILEKTQSLDSVMVHIADLKRQALRQLNDVRPSTSCLPYEILSYIFQLACPHIDFSVRPLCEYDYFDLAEPDGRAGNTIAYPKFADYTMLQYRCFPLVLGAVCSRWRKVAWSTAEIWRTFALEVVEERLYSQISLLRLYLSNADSYTVSLEVNAWKESRRCNAIHKNWISPGSFALATVLMPLAHLLFEEFPSNLRVLRLAGVPPAWMAFMTQEKLPQLSDLQFHWGNSTKETVESMRDTGGIFNSVNSSEGSTTIHLTPPPLPLSLTTLHLQNMHLDLCLKILFHAQYLTEFYYSPALVFGGSTFHEPASSWHIIPFREPYPLPNLKRLGWTAFDGMTANNNFLFNVRLPALEELQWTWNSSMEETWDEDSVAALLFFSNLPDSAHTLIFYDQDADFSEDTEEYDYYRSLFTAIPQVHSLTFYKCFGCFIRSILFLLSEKPNDDQSKHLLPSLDSVTIRNHDDTAENATMLALLQMLKARGSASPRDRSFQITTLTCTPVLSASVIGGLTILAHDYSIVVKDDWEVTEYLYFTDRELALLDFFDRSDQDSEGGTDSWGWFKWHSNIAEVDCPTAPRYAEWGSYSAWGKNGWGAWQTPTSQSPVWAAWDHGQELTTVYQGYPGFLPLSPEPDNQSAAWTPWVGSPSVAPIEPLDGLTEPLGGAGWITSSASSSGPSPPGQLTSNDQNNPSEDDGPSIDPPENISDDVGPSVA
ncbi:hypothetical protein NP233_g7297 [Leucocoprinus birnbaumii]|uniref:F-box domain-containing protein n=1 Tax=Leucocoprinus birnbaumii TaxID=56174 RepID=A0AAD5VRQ3_9AGAR|nr:hypothetical protein NP233_g7297 [Leucocoprinus birnbaumii]